MVFSNQIVPNRFLEKEKIVDTKQPGDWNTQLFKLAGVGVGLIVCRVQTPLEKELRTMRVLIAVRAIRGEEGLGITGGGFVECKDIFFLKVGSIVEIAYEAHRENREENKGFEFLIPADEAYLERVQPIATLMVRTNDINKVHACVFSALTVTPAEFEELKMLAPGPERLGPLLEVDLHWEEDIRRARPEESITMRQVDETTVSPGDFFHKHEVRAFGMLAWHSEKGKLWQP